MKVLIVVTHLLGTGHLARALVLGQAFREAGHLVRIASGGRAAPQLNAENLDIVQLPPLASNGVDFTTLLGAGGRVADPAYLKQRQETLVETLRDFDPDILITELFPFGRRVLSGEFIALLQAAGTLPERPLILCSIRDILAPPSRPEKAQRANQIVTEHYDGVIVHSDPKAAPLEHSWPVDDALRSYLHYSGYVAPPPPLAHPQGIGQGEILVSAGGGDVGAPMFRAAIGAAAIRPDRQFRLLVGGAAPAADMRALRSVAAPQNVRIEAARPDFRQMLKLAAASISLCGYNTALDILQTGVPALFVPFDGGNEVEQTLRANALSALPGISVVRSRDLSPENLVKGLGRVLAAGPRGTTGLRFDGAAETVRLAVEMKRARR